MGEDAETSQAEEEEKPTYLVTNCDDDPTRREIGREAVWTLSSAKSGNGVDQLRDNDETTFWQSDGTQPHHVNIQFLRKKSVCAISFFLNHQLDESYTPKVSRIPQFATDALRVLKSVLCFVC